MFSRSRQQLTISRLGYLLAPFKNCKIHFTAFNLLPPLQRYKLLAKGFTFFEKKYVRSRWRERFYECYGAHFGP